MAVSPISALARSAAAADALVADVRTLTLAEVARMMRAAVKDKSYRRTPVGLLVGRYVRWFRNEWGATERSVEDYESVLSRMALTLADREVIEVTIEDLRDVIDLWAEREPRTRQKVTSVIRAFWAWAEEQGHIAISPAAKLRRPRAPCKEVSLLPKNIDARLLAAAPRARDRFALLCLLDLGVRRAELAGIQVRDVDAGRRQLTVTGKGQKSRVLPLPGRIVLAFEEYLLEELEGVGRQPEPDDFLLYAEKRTPTRVVYWTNPKKPCALNSVHRWWYRQLEAAGLVGKGVRSGMNMHRARHTFATDVRRAHRDVGTVQHLLGHSDASTTISLYGHYDQQDLERAMEAREGEAHRRCR